MNSSKNSDINFFLSEIEKELSLLNFGFFPKELYEPIDYTISLGGKRIRPLFLLLANDLSGGKIKDALNPALAIEIFHNFTLVHDDIMDNAPIRRNKPTVFKKWNNSIALLSGDVMLVWAYRLLSQCEKNKFPKILEVFNETAIKVCEGQQIDMNFEKEKNVSIEKYIEMISLKTATLIAGCMKIGAVLGGANEKSANHLYEFGKNIGIAFQLQDDFLDVFGNPEKFGKQIGGDIISNKKTFLLLKAFELADGQTKSKLNQILSSPKISSARKVNEIKNIYEKLGVRNESEKIINQYYSIAVKYFSKINAEEKKKKNLLLFVENLMQRNS